MSHPAATSAAPAAFDSAHWQARLDALRAEHHIPGAQFAVHVNGELREFASGVLNLDTGVEVTTDSIFQSGSVAKVYTATAVMRLVDAGRLSLEDRVADLVPEFGTPDPEATAVITVRNLLSHTAGFSNDFNHDTGRGEDAISEYVKALASQPLDLPPNTAGSYGSPGIVVLGRIIEILTGKNWNEAMNELLFEPLGLKRSMTLPEEALRYRVAMGHLGTPGERPEPAPVWSVFARAFCPAAQVLVSAGDMVRFGKLHLDGGVAEDGTRLLSEEAVARMQRYESDTADRWSVSADAWGLGWCLYRQPGFEGYGHDGSAVSQHSILRVFPAQGVVISVMANSGDSRGLFTDLLTEFLPTVGLRHPAPFGPADPPLEVPVGHLLGTYKRPGVEINVTMRDGRPYVRYEFVETLAGTVPPLEAELRAVDGEGVFAAYFSGPGINEEMPVVFKENGGRLYCWIGLRGAAKVG